MTKKIKAKNDGNAQPASGQKAELAALMTRINTFGKSVVTLREEAQQLLLDVGFHAMQYGNLKPFTALIKKSDGMNRKGMVSWGAKAFGIKAEKDKDTGEERIVGDKAFKDYVAEFKADKLAFAKRVRALPKFWAFAPDRVFEGLDLIKLVASAITKTEKAAADKEKASKVKGTEHLASLKAWLNEHKVSEDDDGGEGEAIEVDAVDSGPINISEAPVSEERPTLQ